MIIMKKKIILLFSFSVLMLISCEKNIDYSLNNDVYFKQRVYHPGLLLFDDANKTIDFWDGLNRLIGRRDSFDTKLCTGGFLSPHEIISIQHLYKQNTMEFYNQEKKMYDQMNKSIHIEIDSNVTCHYDVNGGIAFKGRMNFTNLAKQDIDFLDLIFSIRDNSKNYTDTCIHDVGTRHLSVNDNIDTEYYFNDKKLTRDKISNLDLFIEIRIFKIILKDKKHLFSDLDIKDQTPIRRKLNIIENFKQIPK